MSAPRSILGAFRHWLLRETGLYLGLLAVAMQLGLAVAHIAPAQAETEVGVRLCSGASVHDPLAPDVAHSASVCPLCQLPPLGPEPAADVALAVPVIWHVAADFAFDDAPAPADAFSSCPIQPRAPPVSA